MKKILFAIAILFSMTVLAQEKTAEISTKSIDDAVAGKTVTMPIKLTNNYGVTGFSFRLYLPEGISVAKNSHVTISEERDPDENFAKNITNTSDGAKQISAISPDGIPFVGEEGTIVEIVLTIAETVKEDIYPIKITNITFTDANAVQTDQEDFEVKIGVGMKTAINSIEAASENENAPMYNLAGQRVSRVQKGIFIQNGKKVLK